MGPNSGIFDQRAAEKAVKEIEVMGFDAIEFGNVGSWILECIHKGLLRKEELGLEDDVEFDPRNYRIEFSHANAKALIKLAELVAYKFAASRRAGEELCGTRNKGDVFRGNGDMQVSPRLV